MRKSNNRREHTQQREREHRTSSGSSSGGLMGDSEGDAAGKLFVGGVSWQTTEVGLREHFGKYGELTDAALMRNKHTGQPRGFGFVKFKDSASADRVMAETHVLDGRTVDVKKAVPRDKSAPTGTEPSTDGDATSETSSFSRLETSSSTTKTSSRGSAGAASTTTSSTTNRSSKPPAWKTLGGSPPSVTSAVGINGGGVVAKLPPASKQTTTGSSSSSNSSAHSSSDRQAAEQSSTVSQPSPRSSTNLPPPAHSNRPEQLRKIFVGGLAPSVTDTDFRQYFEQFGSISDAVVMFDRQTQRSRGFGFITFESSDSLESVLELDKHEIKGKVVEVKRAEPKEPVRASEDSGTNGASQVGGQGGDYYEEEEGVIQEYTYMPYGALSLQESCPIPGTGAMGMVFGVHYQHYDDGRGYGIYVPGVPFTTHGGAVVAMPMGCTLGVNSAPFAFAPMPPTYYGSISDSSLQAPPSFDYERAWHGGDFSMDEEFNATGYGAFRGQAATHGRLRRKYRPY